MLKAVGIIAIVLHNYFHLLPGAARENEFAFSADRFPHFLALAADPLRVVQASFAYLGHYGVQLFIFLSGYGLALRYWDGSARRGFLRSRIGKIYPTFLLSLGLYFLLKLIQDGPAGLADFLGRRGDDLLFTALGVLTLIPGRDLPPVGPWWFLPFIMQLYCIWPGLAACARRFGRPGLVLLAAIGLVLVARGPGLFDVNLLMTPLGHLPELALGIAVARFGSLPGTAVAAVAAGLFIAGNPSRALWPLCPVAILIVMLWAYRRAAPALRRSRLLLWIGEISMPLFFVNGYLRGLFWTWGRTGVWYLQFAGGIATLAVSIAVAYGIWRLERGLMAPMRSIRPTAA